MREASCVFPTPELPVSTNLSVYCLSPEAEYVAGPSNRPDMSDLVLLLAVGLLMTLGEVGERGSRFSNTSCAFFASRCSDEVDLGSSKFSASQATGVARERSPQNGAVPDSGGINQARQSVARESETDRDSGGVCGIGRWGGSFWEFLKFSMVFSHVVNGSTKYDGFIFILFFVVTRAKDRPDDQAQNDQPSALFAKQIHTYCCFNTSTDRQTQQEQQTLLLLL